MKRSIPESYGDALPRYSSSSAARRALFGMRDDSLAHLRALAPGLPDFAHDGTPASLIALEGWYFSLVRSRAFTRLGTTRARFERAMGFYVGHVAVRSRGWRWRVRPFAFAEGKYEVGVESADGLGAVMGVDGMCADWREVRGNVRQRALHRQFMDRWPEGKRKTSAPRNRTDAGKSAGVGKEMIEAAIRAQLGLRSSPLVYPGSLGLLIERRLRGVGSVRRAEVNRVAREMAKAGVIERVPLARGTGFRYRLAGG